MKNSNESPLTYKGSARIRAVSRKKCAEAYTTKAIEITKEEVGEFSLKRYKFSVNLKDTIYEGEFDGDVDKIKQCYFIVLWYPDHIIFCPKISSIEPMKWYNNTIT